MISLTIMSLILNQNMIILYDVDQVLHQENKLNDITILRESRNPDKYNNTIIYLSKY